MEAPRARPPCPLSLSSQPSPLALERAQSAQAQGDGGPAPRLPSWEALGNSLGLSEPLCLCNSNTCLEAARE